MGGLGAAKCVPRVFTQPALKTSVPESPQPWRALSSFCHQHWECPLRPQTWAPSGPCSGPASAHQSPRREEGEPQQQTTRASTFHTAWPHPSCWLGGGAHVGARPAGRQELRQDGSRGFGGGGDGLEWPDSMGSADSVFTGPVASAPKSVPKLRSLESLPCLACPQVPWAGPPTPSPQGISSPYLSLGEESRGQQSEGPPCPAAVATRTQRAQAGLGCMVPASTWIHTPLVSLVTHGF